GRTQNLYPGVSRGTQTAQSFLPDLRLDGRLDSRSASKSLWCRGWVFQRPEFPASRSVDLGGGDVRLDDAAIRHSAFPARSTGSERELNATLQQPAISADGPTHPAEAPLFIAMRATDPLQDLLYFVRDPWPWGKPHEAAGIHRTSRQRYSRMAARGMGAAASAYAPRG